MEKCQRIERYLQRKEEREGKIRQFFLDDKPGFLILQDPPTEVWKNCNTIPDIVKHNLSGLDDFLANDWSDNLPYLEPWIGTGVFANAFGSPYYWREGEAPHAEYVYHKIDELADITPPLWQASEVMRMVLDAIDALKDATDGQIPICLTDTQSPYDTATLILDASEFFTACYTAPEIVHRFLHMITDLIIEFSQIQAQRIGSDLWARPGHLIPSIPGLPGIAVSDDNLAVASPRINRDFSLPYLARIGEAFDGIAVHSCGTYVHSMPMLSHNPHTMAMEMAIAPQCDPNPNPPEQVRDADIAPNVILKARVGAGSDMLETIRRFVRPDRKIIIQLPYSEENAREQYEQTRALLETLYG